MKILWTDGSAVPNPGQGGYAVIDEKTEKPVALGRESRSTNIRMEGWALLAALELAGDEPCEIHTDSQFWINVLTKWAKTWETYDWQSGPKHNKPIQNLEIVQKLYQLYKTKNVKLVWERGHVGTKLNELADFWANRARRGVGSSEIKPRDLDSDGLNSD